MLLTGAPGVGKTTVVTKTLEALQARGVCIGGMISREVREDAVRVGFEILDVRTGKSGWLANANLKNGPQVGKYHVNLKDLDDIGAQAIVGAVERCSVIGIDEIGPMELYSPSFKEAVAKALHSRKAVLAVIHAKAKDALIAQARNRTDAEIIIVTSTNRDELPNELAKKLLKII
ncbi:MAG: NTPase [Candidatus Bathyarchaeota archaeon]|nr:NTPase [Candidatus Bathyarchaeota archaeon]